LRDGDRARLRLRGPLVLRRHEAARGPPQGRARASRDRAARRDLAVRHVQQPRILDEVVQMGQGARDPDPGDRLHPLLRGDHGRIRSGHDSGDRAPRRLAHPAEEAARRLRRHRQAGGPRALPGGPGEDRVPDRADLRRADQEGLPRALGRRAESAGRGAGRAPPAAQGHARRDHGEPEVTLSGVAPALAALVLVAGSPNPNPNPNPTPRPKPTAAAANACTPCKERRPTLPPEKFAKEPEVAQGYAIALRYPATLDAIHCFCECAESPMYRHKTLL